MLKAASSAPVWAHDLVKQISQEIDRLVIPRVPRFALADLPAAAAYYNTNAKNGSVGLICVAATGGDTICFSDGSDWIDLQTGSAVA